MASIRAGAEPRSRSGHAGHSGEMRPRRLEGSVEPSLDDFPSIPGRRPPRRTAHDGPIASQFVQHSQPKASSRTPQTSSQRRPSLPGQFERSMMTHQPQPWGSVGNAGSGKLGGNLNVSSVSPPSRLPAPGPSQPRNVLRRKPSGLSQETASLREDSRNGSARTSSSSSIPRSQNNSIDASTGAQFDRSLTESPMEVRIAQQVEHPKGTAQDQTIYPELDRYRDVKPPAVADSPNIDMLYRLATHDLPPPTPLFSGTSSQISGFSGSPSTRFSESPGPGPYSRDTTPTTSISSQSPGLVAPIRIPAPRMRQPSPAQTRPPVTRRRAGSIPNEVDSISADPQGLAAVRESLTSSSSNSTVRDGDKKENKKRARLLPLPPTLPLRKSSHKFLNSRDEEEESSSKPSHDHAQPVMTSPSPAKATSSTSPASSARTQHLTSPKATPPTRPSRDGTPDLHTQLGLPMPVIHSNLSSSSLSERRQSSTLLPNLPSRSMLPASVHERSLSQSRLPPSIEVTTATLHAATSGSPSLSKPETGRGIQTPSPIVSTFKTRFPIFGRRSKTVPEASQPEKKDKSTRKGPAAGTGHEGYGRLGAPRRRSSSVTTLVRGLPGTMTSQEGSANSQTIDPFLMERIAPVVIAGGEVVENRNTSSELSRTESNQSFSFAWAGLGSKNSSQVSLSSREGPRHTLWPSAFPRGVTQTPSLGGRRPSDSSDSEAPGMKSTLAFRRSIQKLKSGDQQVPRLPKPIVTRPQALSPSIASVDAVIMSDDSVFLPHPDPGRGRAEAASSAAAPKKLYKRVRSPRRWNFFGRSQSQPAAPVNKAETAKTVAATVKVVQTKPVAFYTMMDSSEQEDADTPDPMELMREARGLDNRLSQAVSQAERRPSAATIEVPVQEVAFSETQPTRQRRPSRSRSRAPAEEGRNLSIPSPQVSGAKERRPSFSRPFTRPPPLEADSHESQEQPEPQATRDVAPPTRPRDPITPEPELAPTQPAASTRLRTGRPSRLPQVGRIPKVVSARPEQISPKSFSRPFNRISMQMLVTRPDLPDTDSVAKGLTPPKPSTPELTQDESTVTSGTNHSLVQIRQSGEFALDALHGEREFLSFSPRKDSQCTTTTSSSSSGMISYADATAIVPDQSAPLVEDEIWDEYNDLLGEDTVKMTRSTGSSFGKPFHLEAYNSKLGKHIEQTLESPAVYPPPMKTLDEILQPDLGLGPITSSLYSADTTAKIKEALEFGTDATSSFSVTEVALENAPTDGDAAGTGPGNGKQVEVAWRSNVSSSSNINQSRRSDASNSSRSSDDNSPLSQVNLRVGSMTVSKWLTFGHVLFSPARDDLVPVVGSLKRHSMLVIDGLGNGDWSFYAAETYPAATFFNLSPHAPLPADHRSSSTLPLSPPNHHQIQYLSHTEKFPFGPQSFTSVVFRFPAAAPESHYRNIISEARRVLKPGGYIELSILDVDLNNMGNKGRRAVRRLKERIHAKAPDTCLGSAADLILRLLGRKGFADIKTCRVGVPVASAIARSPVGEASSKGNTSDSGSGISKLRTKKDDRTLAEMMNDESSVADESITKMVAKVGRWWYSQCYESGGISSPTPSSNRSMWNDRALLAECEEWRTSLKLMVCHARVPDGRGRVASI